MLSDMLRSKCSYQRIAYRSQLYTTHERKECVLWQTRTNESGHHLLMTILLYRINPHLSALFLKLFHIFYYCQKTFKWLLVKFSAFFQYFLNQNAHKYRGTYSLMVRTSRFLLYLYILLTARVEDLVLWQKCFYLCATLRFSV